MVRRVYLISQNPFTNSATIGDMVYLEALGQPFLLLNSLKRSTDLLDKRSAVYSDRPTLPVFELFVHLLSL